MTSYHYQTKDIELGGAGTGHGKEDRLKAMQGHGMDTMHTLKRRPSMSDHTRRLTRKTSSRLGLKRKNSIGFHNEGTLWEHIITCKMDAFDCCLCCVCCTFSGLVFLGVMLVTTGNVNGDEASTTGGWLVLGGLSIICMFLCVINANGGWKA